MKEPYTKYTCDNCNKEKFHSNGVGFPYDDDWCYIYNFTGKVLESHYSGIETNVAQFTNKDKHFCSEKCMFEWIKKTVRLCKEKDVEKQKKEVDYIEKNARKIWDDISNDNVKEAVKTFKNSKLI